MFYLNLLDKKPFKSKKKQTEAFSITSIPENKIRTQCGYYGSYRIFPGYVRVFLFFSTAQQVFLPVFVLEAVGLGHSKTCVAVESQCRSSLSQKTQPEQKEYFWVVLTWLSRHPFLSYLTEQQDVTALSLDCEALTEKLWQVPQLFFCSSVWRTEKKEPI